MVIKQNEHIKGVTRSQDFPGNAHLEALPPPPYNLLRNLIECHEECD
jgi:hypothetical protein